MDGQNTEFVQERNSGARKGFYYDYKLGGYMTAKPKLEKAEPTGNKTKLIILFVVGIIGILAYIFRVKLKTLWLKKTKEVLSSED